MPDIETGQLRLIPLSLDHLAACLTDPGRLVPVLGLAAIDADLIPPPVIPAIESKIGKIREAEEQDRLWLTYWLIVIRADNTGAGLIGFKGAPDVSGESEIGYGIAPAYQGQGVMTEALHAIADWAFSQPGCRAITAETINNRPSDRVLEKCAFTVERREPPNIFWRLNKEHSNNV